MTSLIQSTLMKILIGSLCEVNHMMTQWYISVQKPHGIDPLVLTNLSFYVANLAMIFMGGASIKFFINLS